MTDQPWQTGDKVAGKIREITGDTSFRGPFLFFSIFGFLFLFFHIVGRLSTKDEINVPIALGAFRDKGRLFSHFINFYFIYFIIIFYCSQPILAYK